MKKYKLSAVKYTRKMMKIEKISTKKKEKQVGFFLNSIAEN